MNFIKPAVIFVLVIMCGCNHFSNTHPEQNEIWLLDSRVCVTTDPRWKIIAHCPISDVQDIGFHNLDNHLWYETELHIKTADLPDEETLLAFREFLSCKPLGAEVVDIDNYGKWIIYYWQDVYSGIPRKNIEARTIVDDWVCIVCDISWPLNKEIPDGYPEKMIALHKNMLSKIRTTDAKAQNK